MKQNQVFLALLSCFLLSCSSPESYSITNIDEIDSLGIQTFSYENEVPPFPTLVENYSLEKQSEKEIIRVFENGDWMVPIEEFDPLRNGGATMSCEPYFWVMRWRSNNPETEILVGAGMTDTGFEQSGEIQKGGAGIINGFSCFVPAFDFGGTINGNQSNLADVNFEYQIWKYKPKI
jgi:hypothetical protein